MDEKTKNLLELCHAVMSIRRCLHVSAAVGTHCFIQETLITVENI